MATTIRTWPAQKISMSEHGELGHVCTHASCSGSLLETFAGSQSSRLVREASYNQHSYLQHLISTLVPSMTTFTQIFWRVDSSNTSLENYSWLACHLTVYACIKLYTSFPVCGLPFVSRLLSKDMVSTAHVLNSNMPNNRQIHWILTYEHESYDDLCSNDHQLKPSSIFKWHQWNTLIWFEQIIMSQSCSTCW